MTRHPPLVALYVPGDRPDRFGKAINAGADVVFVDLEDSVAPSHKAQARAAAVTLLADNPALPVMVRINGADTAWHEDDLDAIAHCVYIAGVRAPKIESAAQIQLIAERLPALPIHALIESALGVENLSEIARAPHIAGISLGEADLRSELGITDPEGLAWIRARLVVAAKAAGLPAPMMSVYTSVTDLDGLSLSCSVGKSRGFFGRAAIHPLQIPVIRASFLPDAYEIADAREVLAALASSESSGSGVALLPSGRMVDAAMRQQAERVVALAIATHREEH
ncbi:MAG: CoA ester lyase [Nakamurella sp.]